MLALRAIDPYNTTVGLSTHVVDAVREAPISSHVGIYLVTLRAMRVLDHSADRHTRVCSVHRHATWTRNCSGLSAIR